MAARYARRAGKPAAVKLSKTRYQWGQQCEKRLWLDAHRREWATPPDAGLRARLSAGHRVGDLARQRWPGFVLVREPASRHERAEARTRELLADPTVPAICEAAFSFEDLRVRADVVVRNGDVFDLVEVKSTTRVKADHLSDAGVQLRVLEGAGIRIGRVGLLHLNRDYVWTGGEYDLEQLFTLADITPDARAAADKVDDNAAALRAILVSSESPEVAVGRHCTQPYQCPFLAHCWCDIDYHHVCELPGIGDVELQALAARGISNIAKLGRADIALTPTQELARRCIVTGDPYVDAEGLGDWLDQLDYPIACIGVAKARIALPVFEGTAPYEAIPLAWSVASLGADGTLSQCSSSAADLLHDPRPDFYESLAAALPRTGSLLCYESGDIESIGVAAEALCPRLAAEFSERGLALRPTVESHYYDGALAGSFSSSSVRSVLGQPSGSVDSPREPDVSADFTEWISEDCEPARRTALSDRFRGGAEALCDDTREVLEGLFAQVEADAMD
jgi:hypothetical protein